VQTVPDRPQYGRTTLECVHLFFSLLQNPFPAEDEFITVQVYKHEAFAVGDTNNQVVNNNNLTKLASCVFARAAIEAQKVQTRHPTSLSHGEPESVGFVHVTPKDVGSSQSKVLKVDMKVTTSHSVDISNPVEESAGCVLGLVRLQSPTLTKTRRWLDDTMNLNKPYSEVCYSFGTQSGQTLSLEQLFVSKYPMQVASAYTKMLLSERRPMIQSLTSILESEEEKIAQERQAAASAVEQALSDAHVHVDDVVAATASAGAAAAAAAADSVLAGTHEQILSALDLIDELQEDLLETYSNACLFATGVCMSDGDHRTSDLLVPNAVIAQDVGGQCLRRSVWKKTGNWQFCTVNLNLHLMSSVHYTFSELQQQPADSQKQVKFPSADEKANEHPRMLKEVHLVPTLTLGCPAAHILKYHEGGLRRIFAHLSSSRKQLVWMQALQSPFFTDTLNLLFRLHKADAESLFGPIIQAHTQHTHTQHNPDLAASAGAMQVAQPLVHDLSPHCVRIAQITARKFELAKRVDMCASQALGFAIASIRTLTMLAAHDLYNNQCNEHEYQCDNRTNDTHKHVELLGRCLKVGFFVCLQSMLSTHGDELGMIEDMEMAALWLHLVSVRFIEKIDRKQNTNIYDKKLPQGPDHGQRLVPDQDRPAPGEFDKDGMSDVSIRRDLVSRVDIHFTCT
jgi:hypothetical protein